MCTYDVKDWNDVTNGSVCSFVVPVQQERMTCLETALSANDVTTSPNPSEIDIPHASSVLLSLFDN